MRLSNLFAGAFIASALLTACTSDEIDIPKSELYAREFVKKFGVIDPSRDLSAATHTGINVVTSKPTDVKVYADIDGKRYIFAEGRKISGKATLTFDLPKGVKKVLVSSGEQKVLAEPGSTVRLFPTQVSRTEFEGGSGEDVADGEGITFCDGKVTYYRTKPRIFAAQDVIDIIKKIPEEQPNTRVDGIYPDFYFTAKAGDIMNFYPLYWNTSSRHSLGIYWLDEKLGFTWAEIDVDKSNPYDPKFKVTPVYDNYMQDLYQTRSGRLLECENYDPETSTDEDFKSVGGQQCSFSKVYNNIIPETSNTAFKAVGVSLKFSKDLKFGFFLKVDNGLTPLVPDENGRVNIDLYTQNHIFFSQAKRNQFFGKIMIDDESNTYIKDDIVEEVDIDNSSISYKNKDGKDLSFPYGYKNVQFNSVAWNVTNVSQTPAWGDEARKNFFLGLTDYSRASYATIPVTDEDGNVIRTRRYFSFEDWSNGPIDLNDLVFIMDGDVKAYDENDDPIPDPEEPEVLKYEWLIAAEDLGGTYDWDFNDAVFAVTATHITDGEDNNKKTTEITVEPLAAGGTMPIYVMFNGEIIEVKNNPDAEVGEGIAHYQIGGELHTWLNGYYRTPINVTDDKQTNTGAPITFVVNGEWSIAQHIDNPTWAEAIEYKGMGGFYVLVNRSNSLVYAPAGKVTKFDESLLDDERNIHVVKPPKEFSKQDEVVVSPEMLCMKNTWNWPKEQCGIHEVYSLFQPWLTGGSNTWYEATDPVVSTQVVRRK